MLKSCWPRPVFKWWIDSIRKKELYSYVIICNVYEYNDSVFGTNPEILSSLLKDIGISKCQVGKKRKLKKNK